MTPQEFISLYQSNPKPTSNEEKQLLLKDLSARLPYGVIVRIGDDDAKAPLTEIVDVIGKDYKSEDAVNGWSIDRIGIKTYLRPMSSMTQEEKDKYNSYFPQLPRDLLTPFMALNMFDWLNAHHFDYRGLIEKGLALEAPVDMYNIKND